MTRRKRLGCPQCNQSYYADRPADNFSKVTLEPCEFPDYDFPAIAQCDNCHWEFRIYWHNLELERKHLVELKELAFLRERYAAIGLGAREMSIQMMRVALREIAGNHKGNRLTLAYYNKFETWLEEFREERVRNLDLSPSELRKSDREIGARMVQFMNDFAGYAKKRYAKWEKTKEFAELEAEERKALETEAV